MERKVSPEQWEQAVKWRTEGMTMKEIGKQLGVSQGRVSQRLGTKREKLSEQKLPA